MTPQEKIVVPLKAHLNPLNGDDFQMLQEIVQRSLQLDELIQKAKAIGLPVEDSEARNNMARDIAMKTMETFFAANVNRQINGEDNV